MNWIIRPLRPEDAAAVACIHEQGQPDTFLTVLGRPFLRALYRLLATAPQCEGYVAEQAGEVVGVIVGTGDTRLLFRRLLWRSGLRLVPAVLGAVLQRPSLLGKVLRTMRYAEHGGAGPNEAEVLFLGVSAQQRRQGIGRSLFQALADACCARGFSAMGLTVDESNETAKRFYRRNGMQLVSTFVMYGRAMAWYSMPLGPAQEQDGEGL